MSDLHTNGSGRQLVLITGSSGLVGTALSRKLSARFHVMGLDKEPARSGAPTQHVYLDLASLDSLDTALKFVQATHGTRIASVVHLAAHYDFSGSPSPLYDQVTVHGTEALLFALRRFDVEQFVFASTMLVHAPTEPGFPLDENSPLGPRWAYPQSKLEAEELIRRHHGDVPIAILRLASVYDDECHSLPLARQIQRIYEKSLLGHVFPGNPEHGQAMLHLDDAADALAVTVAKRAELPPDVTLLVGEDSVLSYAELQRILGQLIHGAEWDTHVLPNAVARAGAWLQEKLPKSEALTRSWIIDRADEHYEVETRRARELIGWSALHRLRASLPRMVDLLQAQPQFFYETNQLDLPSWLKQTPPRPPGATAHLVGT
ncbi:MAG: NAD-dependent epimerase/dehydratase family protein [Myxococcota bacterium]|jgi:nucleoside-diphosphate-sugar epimerase|nr:NAD-dependent epimerase/dehydratase family protein [Myxococcota bacterium]